MSEGTYIRFVDGPPKPKTKTWWVVTKDDDIQLGWVGWFTRWRKYGFFPKADTVYEQVCLREIADFCERETKAHRAKPASGGKGAVWRDVRKGTVVMPEWAEAEALKEYPE